MTEIQAIRKALHEGPLPEESWQYKIESILSEILNSMEEQEKIINAFKLVEKSRWQAAYKNMEQFNQHQSPQAPGGTYSTHP